MSLGQRRSFLKGVTLGAGAVVLEPVLRGLEVQAAGKIPPSQRRVVFVVESNGLFQYHIQPKGIERPVTGLSGSDKLVDLTLDKHDLPDPIAPLAPFKDRITVIQGLSGRISEGGTGGHSTNYGALGCYPGSKGPMAQTIDAALAAAFPGPVPHIGLGILKKPEATVHYSVSASGPGNPLPIQCKPDLAYKSLFGTALDPDGKKAFDLKSNLLDFMADDVKKVRANIAGPEREKLDKYLEAFESLSDRQVKVEGIKGSLQRNAPNPDKFTSAAETDRLEGHFDLAAAALIAGLTNCVTLTSGGGHQHYISYAGLGLPIDGHSIGHGTGVNGKTPEECRVIIRQFHCKLIARLADKLKAVPEGGGTMLDNTLIVYLSDSSNNHHPSLRQWPVLLLGNLGGNLKAGNRFLDYPQYGAKGHKTMANLYLSFLHAAGKPRDKFGLPDPKLADLDLKGPLVDILR